MDDGLWEACLFGVFGVNMERVGIAVESVENCLVGEGGVTYFQIALSFGSTWDGLNLSG